MAAKFGLGKGLDALFPPEESPAPPGSSGNDPFRPDELQAELFPEAIRGEVFLPLDHLSANPSQPRKAFDEAALEELADSIRVHGVIQPIIAEKAPGGGYIIVAGERRCRAARLAGLTEVPALLREYTDEKRMEISLIENIQRADLNPVEEASAYRHLMDVTGLSQDEIAARVGKNRSTVTNALRLLKLPIPMLEALESGKLSPGHGRALLAAKRPADQETLFREIIAGAYSVREAEKRAAALNSGEALNGAPADGEPAAEQIPSAKAESAAEGEKAAGPPGRKRAAELAVIEQQLIDVLGTKVSINGTLERGSILIDYYSMDDLDRLYELIRR